MPRSPSHCCAQVRVKCNEDDTIGDLKKLIAAQVGTRPEKIRIQKWYTVYKVTFLVAVYFSKLTCFCWNIGIYM